MYAQLTLIGHVGQKPELRETQSGVPVCNFSVAVNRTWKDADGEQQQTTTWYKVAAWRRQAAVCYEHLDKGDRVLIVSDTIDVDAWIDQSGLPKANIVVTPRTVRFLSSKGEERELTAAEDRHPFDE